VEGGEAVVRVEDKGVGIDSETLPRIFELFTQEDSSLSRAEGGLGLGLPLVKELVALHGGTVQVRSEGKGKGSEFTVRLPLAGSKPAPTAKEQ
jgi:signal transduction histidine kinase